jgi:DNA uptake protein ComE-like DNA-binding protein
VQSELNTWVKGSIEEEMKVMLVGTIALLSLAGCSQANPSPETIRHDTAKATSEAITDAKAVAKGVADGVKQHRDQAASEIDINKASASELESLPGIHPVEARKIIEARPYDDTSDLVKKRVVSKAEYDRIAGQITTR